MNRCNYRLFCDHTSRRIFELVDYYVKQQHDLTPNQANQMLTSICNSARSHFELKATNLKVDAIQDADCFQTLENEKQALTHLEEDLRTASQQYEKEQILLNWFSNEFIESDELCSHCQLGNQPNG
jgi:septum formation inhibitor MinC